MVCQKNGTKYILVHAAAPHNSVGHGQWACPYPIPVLLVCCVMPVPENQGAIARFPVPANIPRT